MLNRKQARAVALAICLVVSFSAIVKASTDSSSISLVEAKHDIAKIYLDRSAGAEAKDADQAFENVAPDCITYDHAGRPFTLKQEQAIFANLTQVMRNIRADSTIVSIALKDGGAVVEVKQHLACDIVRPGNNRSEHLDFEELDRDFWIKSHGVWSEKRSRTLSETNPGLGQSQESPAMT